MNEDAIRLLLIGAGRPEFAEAAALARQAGADVTIAPHAPAALAMMRRASVSLVMIDVAADVAGFIAQARTERFAVPVLACGIDAPAPLAVAAIRAGARDYVPLPPEAAMIAAALATAAAAAPAQLVGEAPALVRAVEWAGSLARARIPMLLAGEPGTGRALLARAVHAASGRKGRFLSVASAGVAPEIVEAELWGHPANAFAGAVSARLGKFEEAEGGTLFLPDIDRLPPATQARLAMAMAMAQGRDVRIIASTTADLAALALEGRFRGDLAQRFAAARVALPPLRHRGGDVALLATHAAARIAHAEGTPPRPLSDAAVALLACHDWPGNVAELEDVIARAMALGTGVQIEAEDLVLIDGTPLSPPPAGEADVHGLVGRTVDDVERALILKTLERCRGNRTSASGILGISVRTMRNKLKTFIEAGHPVVPAL